MQTYTKRDRATRQTHRQTIMTKSKILCINTHTHAYTRGALDALIHEHGPLTDNYGIVVPAIDTYRYIHTYMTSRALWMRTYTNTVP
jgi:hypothetical protein